jgi:hypothetical protein
MGTDGGGMYHYRGFAGLPESQQPWSGLIDEKMNVPSNGKGEVADPGGEAPVERPLGIPGTLLAK